MASRPLSYISPEEYLERERASDTKHEYIDGEIIDMARPAPAHSVIVNNVAFHLRVGMQPKGCRVFTDNLRVSVGWGDLFSYPDVVVVCNEPKWLDDKRDTLTNPSFIVEVLSPSTMDFDRGSKARLYRMLSSLSEYLVIDPAPDPPELGPVEIEHWRRLENGNWSIATIRDREAVLHLQSLGCDIGVRDIYEEVEKYL